ncbi:hypothetical protein BDW59DRAFT_160180 [Aspergillus cavernicola]|uniref:Polyadenylation factor subunit 2 n=1 Tax=Aspergillus cavernicola TaxID=176166 RepID=A0ABR4IIF3_9EURO
MSNEQFPWLDWPHGYAPPNLNQNAARTEDNSNTHWKSPLYNSASIPTPQTQVTNNNSSAQSQYYPPYQQQEESHVRLEDVLSYPSYQWGQPPAQATASPHQQSPTRPPGRQLPIPMSQATSAEPHIANDIYPNHEAKRRRLEPPVASQAPTQSAPKAAATPDFSQARTHSTAQDPRSGSQYGFPPPTSAASRPPDPPASQPTAQRTSQQTPRPGSQYVPPVQARPTSQIPPRTASPAISQPAMPAQSKPMSRAPSSGSSQTTAQRIPRRKKQFSSPKVTSQVLAQNVPPAMTQSTTAQQPSQYIPRPNSQHTSPHARPQALSKNAPQTATQSLTQHQHVPRPGPQPASQPTSLPPSSQPVSRPAAQSTIPPVPHQVLQNLPPQRPPSAQAAPLGPALSRPTQTMPQMAQALHTQPAHKGPYGNFAAYSFQPENPADKSLLKHRIDIVSCLNEEDAAQKLTYDPKTIARDILIASSRHPTEPTLNHHLFRLRDVFSAVDVTSDLETFRWDLVDSGQSSRDRPPTFTQTSQTAPPPAVQVMQPVNNNNHPQQPSFQTQHRGPQPTFQQLPQPPPPKPHTQSSFQVQLHPPSQPQPQPKPQRKPQRPPVSAPAPTVSRPQPQVEAPSTPNSDMEKRRRGRPPGSTNKPKAIAVVAPPAPGSSHSVFACRWNNCQAELHNLDLLKKHIFKTHVSYQITCGWKSCSFLGTLPAAELMKHVKKNHLESVAWKLGDGPVVPTSVDRNSGARAVPFTIPESNQPGSEDSLIFPANYGSIRAFNKVHGNNSQDEKAREIMRAVQRLKEHVGIGLDPGGCELATPERGERVSNDEDVYEVRSGS